MIGSLTGDSIYSKLFRTRSTKIFFKALDLNFNRQNQTGRCMFNMV